jgi:uncharacterized protein YbbC (DUF1343 family)
MNGKYWSLAGVLSLVLGGCAGPTFLTGLDRLAEEGFAPLRGKRVGVVTNATGVDREMRGLPQLLASAGGVTLVAIFAPEHGISGAAAAGKLVEDSSDPRTRVPVHSLYGSQRKPTREMLQGIDVLLFDIQDVGARPYTYLSTLVEVLDAAGECGVDVWVLDRPLAAGGRRVEGPVLEESFRSFVGAHTIALRHGLTPGEFARLVRDERKLPVKLRVFSMEGYRSDLPYDCTGLVWVPPSPNIPTLDTVAVYPGMVLLEGTNLSEGRGTTRPFQLVGAPWVDPEATASRLQEMKLEGALFRPARFIPWDSKYDGEECGGVEIHVTDRRSLEAVRVAVSILAAVRDLHPGKLEFRAESFDRLAGTRSLREALERGDSARAILESWKPALDAYRMRSQKYLLYP